MSRAIPFFPLEDECLIFQQSYLCAKIDLATMSLNYNYDKLFEDALQSVLADYSTNKVQFHSEHDLLCNVFYECRKLMQSHGFPAPLKLYAQKSVDTVSSRRTKVDLVLGDDEVLIEFKVEPDYPGVNKPVVFYTKMNSRTRKQDGTLQEGSSGGWLAKKYPNTAMIITMTAISPAMNVFLLIAIT